MISFLNNIFSKLSNNSKQTNELKIVIIAILLGIVSFYLGVAPIVSLAQIITDVFLKFLQLMSAPIVFFAIITNIINISGQSNLKLYSKKVIYYTLLTTITAATVAYILYQVINPVSFTSPINFNNLPLSTAPNSTNVNYLSNLLNMFPNNIIKAFLDNNVLGIAIIALILGYAIIQLPQDQQNTLKPIFNSLFNAFINIAKLIIKFLPIGIWAFTVIFLTTMSQDNYISGNLDKFGKYLLIVVGANFIQGLVILPALLKAKNISPISLLKSVYPALTTAFFSKSSSAALPITMDRMTINRGIKPELTKFCLPLCTIINMNGCAAFIYTTVLFVASQYGIVFSWFDYILWIFIATIVAIGNASIPMGCYFLSSAILVGMGVDLKLMALILPIYTFIDMIETALNVWSDCCVTEMVAKDTLYVTEDIALKSSKSKTTVQI